MALLNSYGGNKKVNTKPNHYSHSSINLQNSTMAKEEWREITKSKPHILNSEVSEEFSLSFSVPSQPPDIRNWFSSYESQELLDPIKDLNSFDGFGEDGSETQDPFEDFKKRKLQEENETKFFSSEKIEFTSKVCSEIQSEEKLEIKFRPLSKIKNGGKIRDENHPLNYDDNNSGTKGVVKKKQSLKKILGEEFLISCQKISNDKPNSSKTEGHIENNSCSEFIQEESRINDQDFNSTKYEENCYIDSIQEEMRIKPDDFNLTKSGKKHKEELSKENPITDGFVSIKSKPKISKEIKNVTKIGDNGKKEGIKRPPLVDKINNYPDENEIKTVEFKGKWKCPQKTKPYVGPPLKQLRIEQWLNRAI